MVPRPVDPWLKRTRLVLVTPRRSLPTSTFCEMLKRLIQAIAMGALLYCTLQTLTNANLRLTSPFARSAD